MGARFHTSDGLLCANASKLVNASLRQYVLSFLTITSNCYMSANFRSLPAKNENVPIKRQTPYAI